MDVLLFECSVCLLIVYKNNRVSFILEVLLFSLLLSNTLQCVFMFLARSDNMLLKTSVHTSEKKRKYLEKHLNLEVNI